MSEIKDIITLTLSKKDECCPNIEQTINFLTTVVPQRGGIFYFTGNSFNLKGSTIALFKYEGKLIGKGIICDTIENKELTGNYNGYYIIKENSIEIFKKPISLNELQNYAPEVTNLTRDQRIDIKYLENIKHMINDFSQENFVKEKENSAIWSMNISKNLEYEEAWNLFKDNSCVSIDYFIDNLDNDYSSFKSTEQIRDFLNDEKSIQPEIINSFVNKIEIGDIFIAHKGINILAGIGRISSDYIYQNDSLKHVRKINWIYTPDDMQLKEGSFFATSNIVRLDEEYRRFVNEIFARIARNDKQVRYNLLNFIFNNFYDDYFITDEGQQFFNDYSVEKEYIKNCWNRVERSDSIEDKINIIWNEIFDRKVGVLQANSNHLRNMNKNHFTEDEMDESIMLFYNTVNNILDSSNVNYQKRILEEFVNNKLSKGFGVSRLTPILYYLDDSFYPINKKTVAFFNFLSLSINDNDELSNNLREYVDKNIIYHEFLDKLRDIFSSDKCDMGDVRIFNEFSYWICSEEGYLWFKKANILPFSLLGNISQKYSNGDEVFNSTERRNVIYFGAPGTGKSYNLNQGKINILEGYEENYERVTFHPDYSYANFVGTYKPVPEDNTITYKYVPGPFMRSLVKALKNPSEAFLLIIEEINRANVAAVFGDVFQLLDRNDNNVSIYPIEATEDMKTYLKDELNENFDKISIPSNLYIWATMNSADQGVFPMDTAFKRRWDFKYFGINHNEHLVSKIKVELNGLTIYWNDLRKAINEELLTYKINEDKLLGPFFAFNEYLEDKIPIDEFKEIFKNKIIMYLFEDAARSKRNELFSGVSKKGNLTYSEICESFDEKGVEIFCGNIKEKFIKEDD